MTACKILMFLGLALFLLGLLLNVAPNLFSWFGKLPGDIRFQEENRFFFFPLTSMLIISVLISLFLSLYFRK